ELFNCADGGRTERPTHSAHRRPDADHEERPDAFRYARKRTRRPPGPLGMVLISWHASCDRRETLSIIDAMFDHEELRQTGSGRAACMARVRRAAGQILM